MAKYGSTTWGIYGTNVYGLDPTTPDQPAPTPPPDQLPDPTPPPGPDQGPGPRPVQTGGEVTRGQVPQFSVAPFTAQQIDYGALLLTWIRAQGGIPNDDGSVTPWRFFRLVRSFSGMAVDQNDGDVILDQDSWYTGTSVDYFDTELTEGQFYYYSIWIGTSAGIYQTVDQAEWYRAGDVVGLPVKNYGWPDKLWHLMPPYYRSGIQTGADLPDNDDLKRYLDIIGFHLDMVNTEYDLDLDMLNTSTMSYADLETFGDALGTPLEPTVPARLNRLRIENAAHDQQLRGTPQGLENVLNALTGWNVDIGIGKNLLLNGDQSGPDHPVVHPWVYEYIYEPDEITQYAGFHFKAKLKHQGRVPVTDGTEDIYWAHVEAWQSDVFNPDPDLTGPQPSLATWGVGGDIDINIAGHASAEPLILSGLPGVLDFSSHMDSAFAVKNDAATARDLYNYFPAGFYSGAEPVMNDVLKDGVPIPLEDAGSVFSASTHVYTPAFATVYPASPFIDYYDSEGNRLARVEKTFWQPVYDSFDNPLDITLHLTSIITNTGQFWSVSNANWMTSGSYAFMNTATPGSYYAYMDMLRADISLGITYKRVGVGFSCGLLLRYQDGNNHIKVTPTDVQVVVNGVSSSLGPFSSAFVDGDRMQVTIVGSAVSVRRNNKDLWSGVTTALASVSKFGLWAKV